MEQRWVRQKLFNVGIWNNLLSAMPADEKEDLKRVVFFQGSFAFAGREIPQLEPDNLPFQLAGSDDGYTMVIESSKHFGPPDEVASTVEQGTAPDELMVDTFRCQQCNRSFGTENHMRQHCSQRGHSPVYTPTRLDGPAHPPEFMAYLNVALQRAMGERLRRVRSKFA